MAYRMILYKMNNKTIEDVMDANPESEYHDVFGNCALGVTKYDHDELMPDAGVIFISKYPVLKEYVQEKLDYAQSGTLKIKDRQTFETIVNRIKTQLEKITAFSMTNMADYEIQKILSLKDLYKSLIKVEINWTNESIFYTFSYENQ